MELILEDVREDYGRHDPYVKVTLEDLGDGYRLFVSAHDLDIVEAVKLLYGGIGLYVEEFTDEQKVEFGRWATEDGD